MTSSNRATAGAYQAKVNEVNIDDDANTAIKDHQRACAAVVADDCEVHRDDDEQLILAMLNEGCPNVQGF